jgi:hypothetical protein
MLRAGTASLAASLSILLSGCKSRSSDEVAPPARPATLEAGAAAVVTKDAGVAPRPEGRHLYVISGTVDVVETASAKAPVLGTVRAGGAVLLQMPANPIGSDSDCPQGWYAVVPRGFVCGSNRTTDDGLARSVEILSAYRVASHAALPASYGIAAVTPIYFRVPTFDEQLRSEPGLEEHLHKRAALREAQEAARAWGDVSQGQDSDLYPTGQELPDDVKAGSFAPLTPKYILPNSPVTGFLAPGAKVAWVAEFDAGGRTWLVTPELFFVPRDKVKRSVVSGFRGVDVPLGMGVAFVGHRPARKYRADAAGKKVSASAETFAPDTAVLLSEGSKAVPATDARFLETAETGVYVRADEVIVAGPTVPSRWGLDVEGADERRWIEINAKTQVLLLREGTTLTFATLVSSAADTRRGKFRVSSKHVTHAMPFERQRPAGIRAEVPEVILLSEYADGLPASALFAGWWTASWGSPGGGFGIALSPLDARRVFDFATPALPDGWHSVRGDGTWVVVHD